MKNRPQPVKIERKDLQPGMVVLWVDPDRHFRPCKVLSRDTQIHLLKCRANDQKMFGENLYFLYDYGRLLQSDRFYAIPEDIAQEIRFNPEGSGYYTETRLEDEEEKT